MRFAGVNVGFGLSEFLRKPFARNLRQAGMSMIEIMIVVSLLGILMGYIVKNVMDSANQAKIDQVQIAFGNLVTNLQMYKVHTNKFPNSEQGFKALMQNPGGDVKGWRGPYSEENKLNDPWGEPFEYESDGRQFKITSKGPDQTLGTEDDITYPDSSKGQGSGY
jgi:general secretion pathway protein G